MNKFGRILSVSTLVVLCAHLYVKPASASLNRVGRLLSAAEDKIKGKTETPAQLYNFAQGSQFMTCFVPDGPSCEQLLVDEINRSSANIYIQAYAFTNKKIAAALVQAKNRGVDVQVLTDTIQGSAPNSMIQALRIAAIPVYKDTGSSGLGVAHNKVMIFDQSSVFTGSFNFTEAAEHNNAENGLMIINDPELIREYSMNWVARFKKSKPITD